jgi:hypothetical protein
MLAMLIGVDAHIIVGRLIVMGGLLSFWMVWKRRHKEAKGKQRRIAHIPKKKGVSSVPRQRAQDSPRDDEGDILAHNTADRPHSTPDVLADETLDQQRGPQSIPAYRWLRWLRKDEPGADAD